MKKQLLTIMAAFATSFVMAQSIPNGGFENWTTLSCQNPQFFNSSNLQNHGGAPGLGPVNAVQTTDAFHGNYAVKMTTTAIGTDTFPAYVVDFNPNGSSFTGGIPYSQQPTSLRFRYKCNVMLGDTALIAVFFKKSGVTFSQNIQKITGSVGTYSLGVMTFSLSQVPDSVMFFAAASNVMQHNFSGKVGSMLQLDSVNFGGVISQPTNMNGDFETWQTYSLTTLQNWYINNSTINDQTTDKYAGNYALELKTTQTNQAGDSADASNASTGYSHGGPTLGGYPFTLTSDTLKFHYKYVPGSLSDSAQIQLDFKKNGVYIGTQSNLFPAAASYTTAVMTFSLASAPDSVIITINSSKNWRLPIACLGSDLKIDNMYFASQATPVTSFILPSAGCVGQPVQLTDMSSNIPTTWTWTTAGGSPASSNSQNPMVTYTNSGTYTVTLNTSNSSGMGTPVSQTITINPTPAIFVPSATVCVGNTATLTANGATTYTWNTGATGATISSSPTVTTNYTVTGTSTLGCSNIYTTTVTVNPLPTLTITPSTTTLCIGSTATLTASGASTYTWNTSASGATITPSPTVTTDYTVTGTDANVCSSYATLTVTVNTLPTVTVNSGSVCAGSSFTINPTGANTYTYSSGSSVVTPTTSASYTVTGTNTVTTCSNWAISSVTVKPAPFISSQSGSVHVCDSTSKTFTVTSSAASDTYQWYWINVASPSSLHADAGTYQESGYTTNSMTINPVTFASWGPTGDYAVLCVVTNTVNCTKQSKADTIFINTLPTVTASSSTVTLCAGHTATLTASGTATSYTWSTGATTTTVAVSPTVTTTYTLTGKNANGCDNMTTITQSVSTCGVGIEQYSANNNNEVSVFPNPNNGSFVVTTTESTSSIMVTDILGNELLSVNPNSTTTNINLSTQPSGVYFIKLIIGGSQIVKRIIINN